MSDEPIKESYIKLISQYPAATDLSPSDLLLLQDVSDENEPYKKATALSVAQTAISDETTASDTTWSSAKIQEGLDNALPDFASLPEVTPKKTDLLLVKDSEGYKKSQIKSIAEAAGLKTVNITLAEYEALSEAEKMDDVYYNITDTETDTHDMIERVDKKWEVKSDDYLSDPNTDLNTLFTIGVYSVYACGMSEAQAKALNYPSGINGTLIVVPCPNKTRVKQIFTRTGTIDVTDNYTYIREINKTTNKYGKWHKLITEDDTSFHKGDVLDFSSGSFVVLPAVCYTNEARVCMPLPKSAAGLTPTITMGSSASILADGVRTDITGVAPTNILIKNNFLRFSFSGSYTQYMPAMFSGYFTVTFN